jgi:hypothetical protein
MPQSFDKIVDDQFSYLIANFQFRFERCKKIDGGFDILYVNNSCGVHIVYEFREAYLFITLHKLQSGKFVDNPRPIKPESILTGYSLDDILLQRAPDAIIKPAYSYGADSEFYDKERGLTLYVSQFAKNLKSHAADILSGDFKMFKTLEPIVKKRAQEKGHKNGSIRYY